MFFLPCVLHIHPPVINVHSLSAADVALAAHMPHVIIDSTKPSVITLCCVTHAHTHSPPALVVPCVQALALAIHSRVCQLFDVDIHPGARIGRGVMLDHATGIVIGETAVVGENVSMLHHVSLGGSGTGRGEV
eukprot:326711-Pelagomonas_calceolata.AAC.4